MALFDKFGDGLDHAIEEIIVGIFVSILVSSSVRTGLIPSNFAWVFHLLSIVGTIVFIQKVPYWATTYCVGWLVGVIILANTGLLTIIDILINFIPLGILVFRVIK